MPTTIYLWDLAHTLFTEKWNMEKTGLPSFNSYVESLGYNLKTISPREYEQCYEVPFKQDLIGLGLSSGFVEVLTFAKHNEPFTTGMREQMDWRAEFLNPLVGFDVRKYFQKVNSTFDFGETNIKTAEMYQKLIREKYTQGYRTIVYADDKLESGQFFLQSSNEFKNTHNDYSFRFYHSLNDNKGLRQKNDYWEMGNLLDLLKNETEISRQPE